MCAINGGRELLAPPARFIQGHDTGMSARAYMCSHESNCVMEHMCVLVCNMDLLDTRTLDPDTACLATAHAHGHQFPS